MQLPTDDRHNYSKDFLYNNLAILLGGRVAEELVLNHITTGAGNDIERATDLDRKSTRLNSSHPSISYAVFCLKKKKKTKIRDILFIGLSNTTRKVALTLLVSYINITCS